MNLEIELPIFITPFMKKWLWQYKLETIKDITTLGLFYWEFRPNRRKPEKPRRIPRVGEACKLIESSFKRVAFSNCVLSILSFKFFYKGFQNPKVKSQVNN